jgi:hypothetical protein
MRGFRKGGEKMNLCRDCLFEKLSEYLLSFPARAVVVQPMV